MTNRRLPDLSEDFDDFFESSLCGYVLTNSDGKITRVNRCVAQWADCSPEQLVGKRLTDLLAIGSRIYFETHLFPLLRIQGQFDEVSIELADKGLGKIPVYINGYERKDHSNKPVFVRYTLFKAADRRLYEENLREARKLAETKLDLEKEQATIREQFIAVLGHDLRNPLGGIMSASQLLARSERSDRDQRLINVIQSSSVRMYEMISNIMDLARGRLGGGISVHVVDVDLEKLLSEVSAELKLAHPDRQIEFDFQINRAVRCDPGRIAQLVSNLLANAITHGSWATPVILSAKTKEWEWEISVTNTGEKIQEDKLKYLFHPFQRGNSEVHQSGLGLGLYISSEIAKAHQGVLSVTSEKTQTCFTLLVSIDAKIIGS